MDFFNESVRFDPVNHYFVLSKDELVDLKKKMTIKEIKLLEDSFVDQNISYKKDQISVVFKEVPSNFDRKDYVSLATYYWPNPDTKDGLPYISKDGMANPEGNAYDKDKLRRLAYLTYYQGLLYYLTGNKRYQEDLIENCNYFFLDLETGMNPNMNHAQMIKGVNLGRGIGIIDFSGNFTYALLMLKNLEMLGILDEMFQQKMKHWIKEFLDWLTYHPIALQEKYAKNNHGTFYDFLLLVLYHYLDMEKEILPLACHFMEERILPQMKADGSLPQELARTKSISYSLMGLKGFYDFARVCLMHHIDLYNTNWYYHPLPVKIEDGVEFLFNHLILQEDWKYPQITIVDKATYLPLLFEIKKLKKRLYPFNGEFIDTLQKQLYLGLTKE